MSVKNDEIWDRAGELLVCHMGLLDIDSGDAEIIVYDIMERCAEIPIPTITAAETASFGMDLAAVLIDLVSAEQRLIEARTGRMPGRLIGDWPPTPIVFEHPYVAAIQRVVNQLEAEGNQARYARRSN